MIKPQLTLCKATLLVLLALTQLACQAPENNLNAEPSISATASVADSTMTAQSPTAIELKLKEIKTTKKAPNGAVVKTIYNVVENPRSLPNLASINRQIERRIDSLYLDFTDYYSGTIVTPQKDTVLIVFGNGAIWSDKIVSMMLDANYYGLGIGKEPFTTKWYSFLHFEQNSGKRLEVSDIFHEGMGQYWDRWVEQNIKPDYSLWDTWDVAEYINGELVEVSAEEYYRRLYTGGNFLIKEDGSVEFNFKSPGEPDEILYTIKLPYEEIKQFYRTQL